MTVNDIEGRELTCPLPHVPIDEMTSDNVIEHVEQRERDIMEI